MDVPNWLGQVLSTLGISTILYGILRYTFLGEFFERFLRTMIGVAPVEVFAGAADAKSGHSNGGG
jgi:hypothetical protein